MSVSGIGSYNYTNYNQNGVNRSKSNSIGNTNGQQQSTMGAVSSFTLHGVGDAEEGDTLLGAIAGGGQSSMSVFKTKDFDPKNPIYKVKIWDRQGHTTEKMVDVSKINPSNCDSVEMYAYSCYLTDSGKYLEAQDTFSRLHSFSKNTGTGESFDQCLGNITNWTQLAKQIMQMQYDGGNLSGYLDYKKFYDFMNDKK